MLVSCGCLTNYHTQWLKAEKFAPSYLKMSQVARTPKGKMLPCLVLFLVALGIPWLMTA